MVLAFYGLFLPDTFGDRLSELYARISPYRRVLVIVILAGLVGFAAILLGAYKYGPTSGSQLIAGIGKNAYWTFVCGLLLSIGIIYFALIMLYAFGFKAPATWRYWVPRPVALVVLPVIFVINGFAPYIGLKTEATISMFSNLHTEGGQTNHIFFDRPPYLFDYQSKIVRILDASPEFIDWVNNHAQREPYADGQIYLVEFDFWDYLHKNPSTSVTYEDESGIHRLERAEDVLHEHPLPWTLRKIFTFKPVDFVRPKICTH
jgi:hypothetical protein